MLRGSRGEAAGIELGSSLVERIAANTGTVLVLPAPTRPAWRVWLGPPSADRAGTGRSRRSSRSVGEPRTGRRVAAVARRKEAAMPKDAPVNIGAPPGSPPGPTSGYRGCRPSFTVGRRPMVAAGSTTCSTSCATRRRCWWRLSGSRATPARTGSDRESKQSNRLKPLTWGFGAPLAGLEPATYGLEVRHDPSAWCRRGVSPQVGSDPSSDRFHRSRGRGIDRIARWIATAALLE